MLQIDTRILTGKLSPCYFTYFLFNLRFITEQQQNLLQTIRLFISEWHERYNWVQTTTEHDVVWSIWAGDHGELFFCVHLNREWQFCGKSNELTDALLVCPPDWAQGSSLLRDKRGLPLPGCGTVVPVLWLLFSRLSMLQRFQPLLDNSLNSFVHHTALTDRDF